MLELDWTGTGACKLRDSEALFGRSTAMAAYIIWSVVHFFIFLKKKTFCHTCMLLLFLNKKIQNLNIGANFPCAHERCRVVYGGWRILTAETIGRYWQAGRK